METIKAIFSRVSRIMVIIGFVLVITLGILLDAGIIVAGKTLLSDCWTCGVFESVYDTISVSAARIVPKLQEYAIVLLSVGFALWLAYKTYTIFVGNLLALSPESEVDENYFVDIAKRFLLAFAVIFLFLKAEPRTIFANTFEPILDFGTSIGRHLLQKKMNEQGRLGLMVKEAKEVKDAKNRKAALELAEYCLKGEKEFAYKSDDLATGALSETTKRNMLCMMREVDVMRRDYVGLGVALFRHGVPHIWAAVVTNVATRIGVWLTTKVLPGGVGKLIKNLHVGAHAANLTTLAFFSDPGFRAGITGIILVFGFFWINFLFAFSIIEQVLFMGVAVILFPFLVGFYVFDETRGYATTALMGVFKFALGLIFLCITIVLCVEVNDWILGGGLLGDKLDIEALRKAIDAATNKNDLGPFNELTKDEWWYFVRALLAMTLNYQLIKSAPDFANLFMGGEVRDGLGKTFASLGRAAALAVVSAHKQVGTKIIAPEKEDGQPTLRERLAALRRKKEEE